MTTAHRSPLLSFLLLSFLLLSAILPSPSRSEVPPFGPSLGEKADVVRAFHMKITGALKKDVSGAKGDGKTGLVGQCNPSMFANFGVEVGTAFGAEQAGIAIVTKGKIATGATGTFPLSRVWVSRSAIEGANLVADRYGGPGVLVLTRHDAAAGARRMSGTIKAEKLEGLDDAAGKAISVEATFDLDFSCGVK